MATRLSGWREWPKPEEQGGVESGVICAAGNQTGGLVLKGS